MSQNRIKTKKGEYLSCTSVEAFYLSFFETVIFLLRNTGILFSNLFFGFANCPAFKVPRNERIVSEANLIHRQ